MLEEFGDFWTIQGDYRCVTTNAILRNGYSVMGKGITLQAAKKYPGLATLLGKLIQEKGNHVFHLGNGLISFPTKWHYANNCDIELIKQSAKELVVLLQDNPAKRILLPKPDCEDRKWEIVKPIVQTIFSDDKFIIVNKIKKIR